MAYKLATFKDENGNLFVEHECQSSESKIVLARAIHASKAERLLDEINSSLKGFWKKSISEIGLYNLDWFGLSLMYLDDSSLYVPINGEVTTNLSVVLPEEWSSVAIKRVVDGLVDSLKQKFQSIEVDTIDGNYIFLSVDFEEVNRMIGLFDTLAESNNG